MPVSLLFAFLGGCNTIESPLGVKAPGAMVEPTWAADGGSVAQGAACAPSASRAACFVETLVETRQEDTTLQAVKALEQVFVPRAAGTPFGTEMRSMPSFSLLRDLIEHFSCIALGNQAARTG